MAFFWGFLILLTALSAGSIASTWCALALWAALFRILIQMTPHSAVWISQAALILVGIACFPILLRRLRRSRWDWVDFAALTGCLFLLGRSSFPQFDVDSLAYHLPALRWLLARHELPEIQKLSENYYVTFRMIGLEEFLLLPGMNGQITLFGGILGGVFKALTLLTLYRLVPKPALALRFAAIGLVLLDDHLVYSGNSTYVYLNPSLIGVGAAMIFELSRAWRGKSRSAWTALALGIVAAGIKYHGLYFLLFAALVLGLTLVIRRRVFSTKEFPVFQIGSALALAFSVFGFNAIETGSPLYPVSFGPFRPWHFSHGLSFIQLHFPGGSYLTGLMHPIRSMVYPGNLALKMAAVFLVPGLIWGLARLFAIHDRGNRWLSLALLGLVASWAWVAQAEKMMSHESRFPRFAMGMAWLGSMAMFLALWRIARRRFQIRIRTASYALGFLWLVWIFVSSDHRASNVWPNQRPNWRENISWILSPAQTPDVEWQRIESKIDPFVKANVSILRSCLQQEAGASRNSNLVRGDGLVVYSPHINWPAQWVAPFAVRGDEFGELRIPAGSTLQYALLPTSTPLEELRGNTMYSLDSRGLLARADGAAEICRSRDLKLVRLK